MADFRLTNHGSLYSLWPLTEAAQDWCDTNLSDERTTFGNQIAVECRYVEPIVRGIIEDGFTIA
jgi:hypothetical protein